MAYRYYSWCHALGIHMYLIPSLIILLLLLFVVIRHMRKANGREKDFEEEMKRLQYMEETETPGTEGSKL